MVESEPVRCLVCGVAIGMPGGGRVVSVAVSDGGVAGAQGKFCSVEHGARWLTTGPPLHPLRQSLPPAQAVALLRGGTTLLRSLLLVLFVVVGVVGLAVLLIVHTVT